MIILGIETTCDETSAAVVENGRKVLANVVSSSVDLHKKYKGVVPEVAAREQVRVIIPVIEEALRQARCEFAEIDAISVAYGPGLIGSLLVGVETVKTLALVLDKPLVPVNHLMGHVYANFVSKTPNSKFQIPNFPAVALIVSGGHTDLLLMTDHGKWKWLGGTRDDAAGEAFDKVARILGLGYPGGPEIEKVASQVAGSGFLVAGKKEPVTSNQQLATRYHLPRPMISAKGGPASGWDSGDFDFSFSGLKTAVVNLVNMLSYSSSGAERSREVTNKSSRQVRTINPDEVSAVAFEFQQAIVDVLVTKTVRAAKKFNVKSIVVGGGVAANEVLRLQFIVHGSRLGIPVFLPPKELSVDNGAMIAAAAFYNFKPMPATKLQSEPGLYFQ